MTKFNVGDKVVPISKTVDWNTLNRTTNHLDKSSAWNKALENEQKYLYVNIIDEIRNLYTCSNEPYGGGDYFHESDLTLYKNKPTKNQRITALENEVAELKLIVHELRGKKSIEPSTTNTVEDIIEFEGQQYKKVDRKGRKGDVVIFRNNNTRFFTNGEPYKVAVNGCPVDNEKEAVLPLYSHGHGRTPETVDVYEVIKEGLNPHIPMLDETIEPLTPNQQRAAIIEKAKAFIEYKKVERRNMEVYINRKTLNWVNAEFIVNEKKKTVVCLIRWTKDKSLDGRGVAKCNPSDVFNEHIGKAIALGRALGLDVSEFEQAVQPTLAIGQIVYEARDDENREVCKKGIYDYESMKCAIDSPFSIRSTIINDTNAIYEVES